MSNLKISLLFIMILMTSGIVTARELTMQEAYERINTGNYPESRTEVKGFAITDSTGTTTAYIFNTPDGAVIASTDDRKTAVYGYLDYPVRDVNELPTTMIEWLTGYANQQPQAISRSTRTDQALKREPIDPMLKTQWTQIYPYNIMCPEYGSTHFQTGCVATAMAQIMYYHRWPEKGTGYAKYHAYMLDRDMEMDLNVTFDWDNMLTKYEATTEGSTQTQKDAVALLMKACGYASNMEYWYGGSGSTLEEAATALHQYFGYDDKLCKIYNEYFPSSEWENIIYNNLRDCGPALYSGMNSVGSNSHAFVCDGYMEDDEGGLFHFNWGWGGSGDGYFRLSALTPGSDDFSFRQSAVIGITPTGNSTGFQSYATCHRVIPESYEADNNYLRYYLSDLKIYPSAATGGGVVFAAIVEQMDNTESDTAVYESEVYDSPYGSVEITVPELADGRYKVTSKWRYADEPTEQLRDITVAPGNNEYFIMNISEREVTFTCPDELLPTCVSFDIKSPLYFGKPYIVEIKLRNDNDSEIVTSNTIVLKHPDSYFVTDIPIQTTVKMQPGETVTLGNIIPEFDTKDTWGEDNLLPDGMYTLTFGHYTGPATEQTFINLIDPMEVYIGTAPEDLPELEVSDFRCETSADHIYTKFRLTCTKGYFASKIVSPFRMAKTDVLGSVSGSHISDPIFLMAGESTDVIMDFSFCIPLINLSEGAEMWFQIKYDPDGTLTHYSDDHSVLILDKQYYTYSAGIDGIQSDSSNITVGMDGTVSAQGEMIRVTNVSGQILASGVKSYKLPVRGVYVISTSSQTTKVVY